MAIWLQNMIVLTAVAACGAAWLWQVVGAARRGKGGCCARGCGATHQAKTEAVAFLSVESLRTVRRRPPRHGAKLNHQTPAA
jgi:hypothetical protein